MVIDEIIIEIKLKQGLYEKEFIGVDNGGGESGCLQ